MISSQNIVNWLQWTQSEVEWVSELVVSSEIYLKHNLMCTLAEPVEAGVTDFGEKDRDESIGPGEHINDIQPTD